MLCILDCVNREKIDIRAKEIAKEFLDKENDKILIKAAKRYNNVDWKDFKLFLDERLKKYINKEELAVSVVKDNLIECPDADLDGIFKFRMWRYKELIEKISKEIYEDYLAVKQYEKIISLIKVIIKNSDPIVYHLNIEVNEYRVYEIYDDNFNNITSLCIDEFLEEYNEHSYTKNDFLLSTILNLTPKVITLRNADRIKSQEFIKTLKKIYEENLIIL